LARAPAGSAETLLLCHRTPAGRAHVGGAYGGDAPGGDTFCSAIRLLLFGAVLPSSRPRVVCRPLAPLRVYGLGLFCAEPFLRVRRCACCVCHCALYGVLYNIIINP